MPLSLRLNLNLSLMTLLKETFKVLAPEITEEPFASLVHDVDANADKIALAAAQIKELYPFVTTTYAFNMLDGSSSAANVMPGNVSATINIRLLPGVSVEKTVEHITQVVAQVDPSIKVEACIPLPREELILRLVLAIMSSRPLWSTTIQVLPLFRPLCVVAPILSDMREFAIPFCVFVRLGQHQKMRQMASMALMSASRNACMLRVSAFLCPLLNKCANNLLSRNLR